MRPLRPLLPHPSHLPHPPHFTCSSCLSISCCRRVPARTSACFACSESSRRACRSRRRGGRKNGFSGAPMGRRGGGEAGLRHKEVKVSLHLPRTPRTAVPATTPSPASAPPSARLRPRPQPQPLPLMYRLYCRTCHDPASRFSAAQRSAAPSVTAAAAASERSTAASKPTLCVGSQSTSRSASTPDRPYTMRKLWQEVTTNIPPAEPPPHCTRALHSGTPPAARRPVSTAPCAYLLPNPPPPTLPKTSCKAASCASAVRSAPQCARTTKRLC